MAIFHFYVSSPEGIVRWGNYGNGKSPKLDGLVIAMFGTPPCRCRPPWPLRNTKSTPRRCFTGIGCGQPGGGPRLSFLLLDMPLISFGLPFQIDFFEFFFDGWFGPGASHGPSWSHGPAKLSCSLISCDLRGGR